MTSKHISELVDFDGASIGVMFDGMPFVTSKYVGDAKNGNCIYELYLNLALDALIIKNKDTGKVCVFDWNDLASLAVAAGIDK